MCSLVPPESKCHKSNKGSTNYTELSSVGQRVGSGKAILLVLDSCMHEEVERTSTYLTSLEYPTMPPAGSSKVLRAPARRGGIRRAPKTKIYNLETGK